MDPLQLVILAVLVFAVSMVVSNLGIGGGVLYVPILLLMSGYDMSRVAPFSLLFALSTNITASFNHFKKRLVHIPSVIAVLVPAAMGSIIGARVSIALPETYLLFLFTGVMILSIVKIADKMILKYTRKGKPSASTLREGMDPFSIRKIWPFLLIVSVVSLGTGFLSGSLGIGGGTITVPLLMIVLGMDTRRAIGSSAMVIPFLTPVGASVYFLGGLDLDLSLLTLIPVALVGGYLGSRLGLKHLRTIYVEGLLLAILVLVMVKMLVSALSSM